MAGFCTIRSLSQNQKLLNYFWFVFIFRLLSFVCVCFSLFYHHWGYFNLSGSLDVVIPPQTQTKIVSANYESAYGLFYLAYAGNFDSDDDYTYHDILPSQVWAEYNNVLGKVRVCQCFAIFAIVFKFIGVVIMPVNGVYAVRPKDLLSMLTQSFYLFICFLCCMLITVITWSTIPHSAFATVCGVPYMLTDDDDDGQVVDDVKCYPNICSQSGITFPDTTCAPSGRGSSFIFSIIMIGIVIGLLISSKHFSRLLKIEISQNDISRGLTTPSTVKSEGSPSYNQF